MKNIVWLASYPKSGNTWLRTLLNNYYSNDLEPSNINKLSISLKMNDSQLIEKYADLEPSELTFHELEYIRPNVFKKMAEETSEKLFVKTHSAYFETSIQEPVIPLQNTIGIIYLIRNPLDVVVSYAHHESKSIDEMIDFMNDENAIIGNLKSSFHRLSPERMYSWSKHVLSWTKPELPVLLVKYEDLLANTETTFSRILHFLNVEISKESLLKAVEFSAFEILKKQELDSGFKEKNLRTKQFFRKGKVGNWMKVK